MPDKFLTVFAGFDCKSQAQLKNLQQIILDNNLFGTQTMDNFLPHFIWKFSACATTRT